MSKTFIADWRFYIITTAITLAFCGIFSRLCYLHVFKADELASIAESRRQTERILYARRGDILDVRGNILAATRPIIQLGVDPNSLTPDAYDKIAQLAEKIDLPESEIRKAFDKKFYTNSEGNKRPVRWVRLKEAISDDVYKDVKSLGIRGVYGNRSFERYYPGKSLASHVLGFMNKEEKAVCGVERFMDFYLRGQNGYRETELDGRRHEMAQYRSREIKPNNGLNVRLTLDSVVQDIVENEVKRLVEDYSPDGISILVSRPQTGEILALANYPDFDPNQFWKYNPNNDMRNRAVTDVYEPGSTFKIVPASAALNEGLVKPSTRINCAVPIVEYEGRRIHLPADDHPLGNITVSEVVSHSSNRGAAQLGMILGDNGFYNYCRAFGFGEKSGYGPGGEVSGILQPVRRWDGLTISRMPMGHAVAVTPMQIHLAMSTVANGGILMRPRIVSDIETDEGEPVSYFDPEPRRRVIRKDTAERVSEMLAEVVSDGTARNASITGFKVAGKTGTAQKIIDGHYSHRQHVASFSGYFPADNPEVVITVVVDNAHRPNGRIAYGSAISAPAFRNIGSQLVRYYAMQPVNKKSDVEMVAVK